MKVLEREHVTHGGQRGDPGGAGGGLGPNRQFPSADHRLQDLPQVGAGSSPPSATSALAHREQCECKDTSSLVITHSQPQLFQITARAGGENKEGRLGPAE